MAGSAGPAGLAGDLHDSARETADRDHDGAEARSAGTEAAGEPRAEPMSRAEYAGYVRREPAAEADEHGSGGDQETRGPDQPGGTGDEPHRADPAEQAQGMTRGEYADHMRQGPAAEEEWPSPDERARLHETYLNWREEVSAGPPSDRRDLPPAGEELLESETGKRSRLDALRREWEKDDVLDGLHSEIEQDTNTIQSILQAHPPEGHPVQVVPDHPDVAPAVPAGIDAGSVAAAGLMAGVVLVEAGRCFHDMLRQRREADHAR